MDFHSPSLNNGKAIIQEDLASFWCNDSEKEEVGRKVAKGKGSENRMMVSSAPKRHRGSNQNSQISRCQVEGCNIDLSSAKDYHRRHRICECHSKSPKVIVAGFERRFCQQCSRFHGLMEFDDKKRSCRRRLSDHNARRRRPHHPDITHLRSAGLTSSIHERRPSSFLVNRLASSLATTTTWESSCSSKMTLAGSTMMRGSGNGSSSPSTNSYMNEAQDFPVALSLLSSSSNSWELSQPKSSSSLHNTIFMHQNSSSISQPPIPLESQNWPLYPPQHVSADQAYSISPL